MSADGTDVLVLGAGAAGLVAARRLVAAGRRVVVLDKGRAVGGRTASRRVADGRHDQGAQFVTLQHEEVADLTEALRSLGALVGWFDGAPDVTLPLDDDAGAGDEAADGHPRYRGGPAARGIAEVLAATLPDVRTAARVTGLEVAAGRWHAAVEDGPPVVAGALVCTAPAPQAVSLLAGVELDDDLRSALAAVRYEPAWTLLATPATTPRLPAHGAARLDHDVVAFVADEHRKGTSSVPAVTVHSTGRWAQDHLEDEAADAGAALAAAAGQLVGTALTPVHVHRWRYATPVAHGDDPAPVGRVTGADGSRAPLALAGDGYVGGRVEGAMRSGHLAARALLR